MKPKNLNYELSSVSAAYQAHTSEFLRVAEEAETLGLIQREVVDRILDANSILCSTIGREDPDRPSMQRLYEGAASRAETPTEDAEYAAAVTRLTDRMLAIHLSVQEFPPAMARDSEDLPVNAYVDKIGIIREICERNGIPSPLPFAFNARKLNARLRDSVYQTSAGEGRLELLSALAYHFCKVHRHFHTAVQMILYQKEIDPIADEKRYDQVLDLFDHAANERQMDLLTMTRENYLLADTYILAQFKRGAHDVVIDFSSELGEHIVTRRPMILEKRLRSLIKLGRMDEAKECIENEWTVCSRYVAHDSRGMNANMSDLKKSVSIACGTIGWWLYGEERYEEGCDFLREHIPLEIAPSGHPDAQDLYWHLQHPELAKEHVDRFRTEK